MILFPLPFRSRFSSHSPHETGYWMLRAAMAEPRAFPNHMAHHRASARTHLRTWRRRAFGICRANTTGIVEQRARNGLGMCSIPAPARAVTKSMCAAECGAARERKCHPALGPPMEILISCLRAMSRCAAILVTTGAFEKRNLSSETGTLLHFRKSHEAPEHRRPHLKSALSNCGFIICGDGVRPSRMR